MMRKATERSAGSANYYNCHIIAQLESIWHCKQSRYITTQSEST